jgi:beta-1,2-mannobiose phosphorylase / 1,2-beta-oligomannan phosphorylase
MFTVARDPQNPFIAPNPNIPWQAEAAYNPSPVMHEGDLHVLYRAATHPALYAGEEVELSVVAVAKAAASGQFRGHHPLVEPSETWDRYGCEDPRVTKLADTYYIFYTALGGFPFGPDNIKVAVALSKDLRTITEKHLVTPFNAKAMALFPEREGGKLRVILTVNSDLPPSKIAVAEFDRPEDIWDQEFWQKWYAEVDRHTLNLKRNDSDHIEVGAPPIWTKDGWLLIYAHIQNYFSDSKTFGIEAALLDLKDPTKVLRRTVYPFMVPEEGYERYGRLPKIIFPSGALRHGDKLTVYYGGTDTTCNRATLSFAELLASLSPDGKVTQHARRLPHSPILEPIPAHPWEASHVLNPTAIEIDGDIHILYRAVGPENTSVIGYARTQDGSRIIERLPEPIYTPRADFEQKQAGPTDNSGCEDARIVRIGDRLYITYTAFNSVTAPRVAESSINVADFLNKRWNWTMPELISPEGVDDKDACIFPSQIGARYMILHRVEHHVCADFVSSLNFRNEKLTRCIQIFGPRPGMWDSEKVGIAGPPIKTQAGWLLFYHGITAAHEYSLGAILLDAKDPTILIGRTSQPIMTPTEPWERNGWIPNVVFPCGQVVRGDTIYLYYGGADHAVGVATASLSEIIANLRPI